MDILTHAAVGAATGFYFGHPVAGAVIAASPDFVLGVKRRMLPNTNYNITHSLAVTSFLALLAWPLYPAPWPALLYWCLVSHIFLDMLTHGEDWAPPLLYPFRSTRFSLGKEWEFFNHSWRRGAVWSIVWSSVWIAMSLFR